MRTAAHNVSLAIALGFLVSGTALAQSAPPQLPDMTAEQSAQVQQQLNEYRRDVDARIASGQINPDEGQRLIAWRQWQIAMQVTGQAPQAPAYESQPVARQYAYPPAYPPYYAPYYGYPYYAPPYYAGPAYWGPSVCIGGFGHHVAGRACF